MAVREGRTTARITLTPGELGQIDIRLRQGPEGISAVLVAQTTDAARAMAEAAGDLRRSLEAQGVTVLDVQVRDGGHGAGAERHADPDLRGNASGRTGRDAAEGEAVTGRAAERVLVAGSTIDVLA